MQSNKRSFVIIYSVTVQYIILAFYDPSMTPGRSVINDMEYKNCREIIPAIQAMKWILPRLPLYNKTKFW